MFNMSDNKIITAKEIEFVEKIDIAEDIDNVTDTNVDISILNDENVVDKSNNQPKSKYEQRREKRLKRAVTSVYEILYSIKQHISYRKKQRTGREYSFRQNTHACDTGKLTINHLIICPLQEIMHLDKKCRVCLCR